VSDYRKLRVAVPPKQQGLGISDDIATSLIDLEVIEFEHWDGVWRCVECQEPWGYTEPTDPQGLLLLHLDNHRANQKEKADQKKILAILNEAYRQIALIKGENK
jgi:hypothetical protein